MMATVADHSYVPIPVPRAPPPSRFSVIGAVLGGVLLLAGASAGTYLFLRGAEHATGKAASASRESAAPDASTSAAPAPQPAAVPSEPLRALEAMSAERLEGELQRMAVLRGMPAAAVATGLDRERRALARSPAGADPERLRRATLAHLILQWHAMEPASDPAARSQDELEAVFLTMQSDLELGERTRMLNELKNQLADDPAARRTVRRRLVEWISSHGGAYLRAGDADEVVIEIEDEN